MLFKRFDDCDEVMEKAKHVAMILATLVFSLYSLMPEMILIFLGIEGIKNIRSANELTIIKVEFYSIVIYGMAYIFIIMSQKEKIGKIIEKIASRIYFQLFTKRGKAIKIKDFSTLKKQNFQLYKAIEEQTCMGACYAVCFDLCRTLEKGEIEIIAIDNSDVNYLESYTAHVIYNQNSWSFDTNTILQYKTDEFYRMSKVKHYVTFSYEEISKYADFEIFMQSIEPGLFSWARENDCWTYDEFEYEF